MKALITAAGLGTRLKPITDTTPKALVPIGGKPLLEYHLHSLYKYGINEILINTHYLPEKIEMFVEKFSQTNPEIKITTFFEPELLGSAGTLKKNADFFKGEKDFLIVYGDNLTNINYEQLMEYHRQKNGLMTIACYYEKHPEHKGIIEFDESNKIKNFIEKPPPDKITSHYANAGIYAGNPELFGCLRELDKQPLDFGLDVFPFLLNRGENMYAYKMKEFLLDIGTLEAYETAQSLIKKINFNN